MRFFLVLSIFLFSFSVSANENIFSDVDEKEFYKVCEKIREEKNKKSFRVGENIYSITISEKNEIEVNLEEDVGDDSAKNSLDCKKIEITLEESNGKIVIKKIKRGDIFTQIVSTQAIKEIPGEKILGIDDSYTSEWGCDKNSFFVTDVNGNGKGILIINKDRNSLVFLEEDFSTDPLPICYDGAVYFVKNNNIYFLDDNGLYLEVWENKTGAVVVESGCNDHNNGSGCYVKLRKAGEGRFFYKFFYELFSCEIETREDILDFCYLPCKDRWETKHDNEGRAIDNGRFSFELQEDKALIVREFRKNKHKLFEIIPSKDIKEPQDRLLEEDVKKWLFEIKAGNRSVMDLPESICEDVKKKEYDKERVVIKKLKEAGHV